jgi:RNA polymerase sigma-70 factor, ECF subfamily
MMSETDRLIKLAAAGDVIATGALVSRHRERLKRMVAMRMDHRLRARFDPSDVVQEALMTVHARLPVYFQEQRIAFYPWLRKIAWEHLLKFQERHVQAHKRSIEREISYLPGLNDESLLVLVDRLAGNITSPSVGLIRQEMKHQIHQALAELKARDREIIELIYLEQLEVSEVVDVLGISRATVWTRHLRAIQRLTKLLGQNRESEY